MIFLTEEVSYMPSPDMSMYDFLYENNKGNLDYIAINYFGKKVSYRELFENIDAVAKSLEAYGIGKGEIVSVCALNTPEFIYLLYALNKIGAVSNWIGLTSPVSDLNEQLVSTKCRTVFTVNIAYDQIVEATEDTLVEQIIVVPIEYSMPAHLKLVIGLKNRTKNKAGISWKKFLNKTTNNNHTSQTNPDDMALIEYTGGSTGIPKGVMLSNKNLNSYYNNFNWSNNNGLSNFRERDTYLSCVPLFLAFGVSGACHGPLSHRMELILAPDPNPETLGRIILKRKPNHIIAGRVQIDGFIQAAIKAKKDLSYIKSIMYGGEPISKTWEHNSLYTLKKYQMDAPILNGYGMTECSACILVAVKDCDGLVPLGNVNVKITDPNDPSRELEYNTKGELCLSSDTLMLGYYQNEAETDKVVYEENGRRWLRTQDLATMSTDGTIHLTGRIKRIYHKLSPEKVDVRVYPMRIEDTLTEHELVKQCAVVGVEDDVLAYRSVAYIIPSASVVDENEAMQQLKAHCYKNLPDSHQPDEYIFVDSFPITRAGKVDYKELERMAK
jgi:long-chain acyl-CoA synthetase